MIVGDNRLCGADHRQESGFANIGEAYETHIGKKFKLQNKLPLLAGSALTGKAGSLPCGGGKTGVAKASSAALRGHKPFDFGHICDKRARLRLFDYGASRNLNNKVGSAFAVALVARAVFTALGYELLFMPEIIKSGEIVIHNKNTSPPLPPSAVGTAGRTYFSL